MSTLTKQKKSAIPVVRIRTNRQVTIPKDIFDALGLAEGDFVEVARSENKVIIKPKKLVDADDILSLEEEKVVHQGEIQLKKRAYIPWRDTKKKLHL